MQFYQDELNMLAEMAAMLSGIAVTLLQQPPENHDISVNLFIK